jgi:hypothetical protein
VRKRRGRRRKRNRKRRRRNSRRRKGRKRSRRFNVSRMHVLNNPPALSASMENNAAAATSSRVLRSEFTHEPCTPQIMVAYDARLSTVDASSEKGRS